ncbi:MAG: hypothetical protein FWG38_10815 [Defluviitaleaceae bacterium]|nr:hypothetical protein [Defluviitaleaceae bacterium]
MKRRTSKSVLVTCTRLFVVCLLAVCVAFTPLSVAANTGLDLIGSDGITLANSGNNTGRLLNLSDDTPPVDWQEEYTHWFIPTELYARQMGLDIVGDIPRLTPLAGAFYSDINQRLNDITEELITEARRMRARRITFSYEIVNPSNITSIVIYATVASAIDRTLVRSVNFSSNGAILTLRDAMGFNVIPLAERILEDRMHRTPESFYAAASVSLEDQAFFMSNGRLTILFDEFQLSSMVSGVIPLEIRRSNIRIASITQDMLLPSDHAYNLMMVPLRRVAEDLGFGVDPRLGGANVWRGVANESPLLAWMHTGVNEYHTPDMSRSLEAAPYNRHGVTYVPITFFDQILPLTIYSVDPFGNITFLAYTG